MPHLDRIRAAFGDHDVTGTKAHVGGPAAVASEQLGAEAYATGDSVAFARDPDLHLAAHEAAHVVQQRQGVSLSGGVGQAGDPYERHADAVADRVVAGRSAVDLLDASPSGGGSTALQRQEAEAEGRRPRLQAFLDALEEEDESAALAAARLLSGTDANAALSRAKDAAVSTFGNATMADCARILVRAGGRLAAALEWVFEEGTSWAQLRSVLDACSDPTQKGALSSAYWRDEFTGELGNAEMAELVVVLGFGLETRLSWMFAEGTDWAAIRTAVVTCTDAGEKAALGTVSWRDRFVGELDNAEMAELVGLLGFDLATSLDWMFAEGTDAEAILPLIRRASAAQRTAVANTPSLMEQLAGELGRSDMLVVLEQIGAPLTETLTVAMDGWGCDAAVILRLVNAASQADKAALAADATLTTRLKSELSDVDWNTVCRALFDAASAAGDIASMLRLFEARFGVAVGSAGDADALAWMPGGAEVQFGVNGLTRIYHLFETLPGDHVGMLDHLMAQSTNHGGAAGGAASSSRPYMRIRYDEARTGDVESGTYTHAGDQMQGMNILDTTTAHELAHRVDSGGTYSHKPSFLALAGWVHYPAGGAATLRPAIQSAMTNPLPAGLSDKETAIAEAAVEAALDGRHKTAAQFTADIQAAYAAEGADVAGNNTGGATWRSAAVLDPILRGANLMRHVAAGHVDNAGWKNEPFAYLPTRQFHEAYEGLGWWSYLTSARTGKLSWYQFRDPGEMFSELYATYHCTNPKGVDVPALLRAWFEAEGLHQ